MKLAAAAKSPRVRVDRFTTCAPCSIGWQPATAAFTWAVSSADDPLGITFAPMVLVFVCLVPSALAKLLRVKAKPSFLLQIPRLFSVLQQETRRCLIRFLLREFPLDS